VKQVFVSVKLQPELVLRAGRFEFSDGLEGPIPDGPLGALRRERIAERLLGPFGFSHVGRSLDGADLRYASSRAGLTIMGARATQGVFRLEGMDELDVGVAYLAFTRNFNIDKARADARAFVLGYRDGRDLPKIDNRPANIRVRDSTAVQIATVGGHLLALTPVGSGNADFLVWGAAQFGEWGRQDHNGFGLALEAGYQWPWPGISPWVRAGYWRGSGDEDPADSRHGTFFQALPTPRVYARFPFYNLMNTEDLFLEVMVRPIAGLTVRADAHALRLKDPADFWYAGGGAFERQSFGYAARPGGDGGLASLIDLSGDYAISPHVGVGAYIGRADPGIVIESIYPTTGTAWLGFLELRWRL
ncbi:MAG TPA: alginate export family protein, partial [Longimicrobiales bacterium]|nr:alginate export family protein [Longimicrobiales bacterium]